MDVIREIVLDGIEALLLLTVFEILYNEKKFIIQNKGKTALFCILYIFANYLGEFYITKSYHTFVISIFCILLLAYITKIKVFSSIVVFFSFLIIISVTECFTQIVEMLVFQISLNQIYLNNEYLWLFLIIAKTLQIVTVAIFFKYSEYFTRFKLFKQEGAFFSNLIIQVGIFGVLIFSINFGIFNIKNIEMYNVFIFIIYFILLILELKELKEYRRFINIEAGYKVQENQIKNMKEIISIIRQEKHDFANHINVIWGLCLLNKANTVERIRNYVVGISDNMHSSFKYLNTGNDYLDGLLSIKNNYAIKNNINFEVNIDEPFSSIKIKENELISIISNLVDNAFESFQVKSNMENKQISISTFIENKKFCVEVANNGDMIPENIQEKVFEKGFSTKTKKSSDHGFGLYIIKQLIEQNRGCISLESTHEETKFLIEFKMKEATE